MGYSIMAYTCSEEGYSIMEYTCSTYTIAAVAGSMFILDGTHWWKDGQMDTNENNSRLFGPKDRAD